MTQWTPTKVRRKLKTAFGPFFVSHGQLNPTQLDALGPLIEGNDALLCSPTASGKTAAAMAPLVERYTSPGQQTLRIVYVVPTRALVNDLYRRLSGPLRDLRLPLVAKTSDKQPLRPNQACAVLLTTPESLDSLLCRQPERFASLSAVILDELHLLDGTYRGDQLRLLLARLGSPLQRVALSATVAAPAELVERYLAPDAVIIDKGEPRGLDFHGVSDPEDAIELLRKERRHKVLWFCDSRQDVEIVAERLGDVWPQDKIVAHHGSLSKRQREDAESAMREWSWGLCVATMTMEIGIDIGDVDAVVLHTPPRTLAAFQQRIGRGCRRKNTMFAIGVCDSPDDLEAYRMFVAMTREGAVEHTAYTPDPSVAVQQLLSLLYASPRGLERGVINNLLAPLLGPADSAALLDHLEQLEDGPVITRRGDVVHATTRAMDFGEKGIIHSNIPSGGGKKFVDAASGKSIGRAIGDLAIGDVVLLAGKSRRVTRITKASVQLEPAGRGATQAPRFSRERTSGAWTWLLPEALRKRGAATSTPNDE